MASGYLPDRSAPPPPGPARAFRFPPFVRRKVPGGPTLFAARREGSPLARLSLLFPAGGEHDLPAAPGLAAFTGALLDQGTPDLSALEIAARIEGLGGGIVTGADWDQGYVAVDVLSRHLPDALDLAAEVAAGAAFPEADLERERRRRLAELMRRRADPSFRAREAFVRTLYGDHHPYGTLLIGTAEGLERLDRDAVEAFYRRHYAPAGAYAVAVGDLDPDELAAELERTLARPDAPEPPPRPDLASPPRDGIRIRIVDRPAAAQTELRIGHASIPRTDPDYLPLTVLVTLLGGKFTSRINLNLRERHGYTYGASCRIGARLGPGPLTVSAAVANPVAGAATREVLGELGRIREEPPAADELADTVSYMVGVFPYTLQAVEGLAGRLEVLAVYGLPDDYYETYPERLRALDPVAIHALARHHLDPDNLTVVAVGPAAELEPQFADLGEVEVTSS